MGYTGLPERHIILTFLQTALIILSLISIPALSSGQGNQAEDQEACQEHAKLSTGAETAPTQATTSTSQPQQGAGLRGAARGAARGHCLVVLLKQ